MVTSRNAVAFIINHPQVSKWVTAIIILVSPASILVGEWLQRQQHFGAWSLYVRPKWDVRHRLHCLVLTDTYFNNITKGKTYRVNQRWCHTTCLQHPCYDVGCYPWKLWSFQVRSFSILIIQGNVIVLEDFYLMAMSRILYFIQTNMAAK